MKSFQRINNIIGWLAFLVSAIVYLLTLEPTVSFWDCGEFIASSYKLQIGHPPGAPLFLIMQRVMSLLAPSTDKVALMMNAFSVLTSAATIMFLYWTIVMLAKKIINPKDEKHTAWQHYLMLASGFIGAMTFAFTDTFWFSAVETEVYAASSLFTAVVFWAMLKWEAVADKPYADRWIVLIAYLTGLSIGVHLLNLLAIPAIALIWYFKKRKPTAKGIIATILVSGAMVAFIMWGVIQGTAKFAINLEVFMVNILGLPYKSGLLLFILLTSAISIGMVVYAIRKKRATIYLTFASLFFVYLGFYSYAMISIRSAANPPMDQNNPQDAISLMKYLNREQYGQTPLLTGYYYNAPAVGTEKGNTEYFAKDGKYVKVEGSASYKFDRRFRTFFPRMYSSQPSHESGYKSWGNIKGKPVRDNNQTIYVPTFAENLRFFFSYQVDHMYLRYFMWNFSGRQNDIQGHGDPFNGNWLTGIGFIDKARLGHNGQQPQSMANPKTTNRYFMLPFLLGVAGMIFQYRKKKSDFWIVMTLSIMTGLAIVVFLNQTPYQPRERDYAYAGSFYAFAIWIGLGVAAVSTWLEKKLKTNQAAVAATALTLVVPFVVLSQNYDDHDRSGRYVAREIAKNYLKSCAENAVLFTYGDNDTFPLWYIQDVEGFRPDVRICNVTLLNAGWYIDQMRRKVYDSDPLPIMMPAEKYEHNNRNIVFVQESIDRPVELARLMDIALSDDPRAKVSTQGGEKYSFIPSKKIKITVDKDKVIATGTVKEKYFDQIEDSLVFEIQGRYITKSDLAILDLLANNNWERPIYFDLSVVQTSNIKLDRYLMHEGFAFRFVPILNPTPMTGYIDNDQLYSMLMEKYDWGGLNNPAIFVDDNLHRTVEIVQVKNTMIRLADQLEVQGDSVRALAVLSRLAEILPYGMYRTSTNDAFIASLYYRLNQPGKGDEVLRAIARESLEKAEFYLDMGPRYASTIQNDITRERNTLKVLIDIAKQAQRDELSNELSEKTIKLLGNFAS
jgi:hypothetical protein